MWWSWCYYNEEKMLYPARWKKITVDQSKVPENWLYRLFRFLWATRYRFAYRLSKIVGLYVHWSGRNLYNFVERTLRRTGIFFFFGGDTHFWSVLIRILNPLPESPPRSAENLAKRGGGGGNSSTFFSSRPKSVLYFLYRIRGTWTWDLTSYPGKNNLREKTNKRMCTNFPELCPNLPYFARNMPEFLHRQNVGVGYSAPFPPPPSPTPMDGLSISVFIYLVFLFNYWISWWIKYNRIWTTPHQDNPHRTCIGPDEWVNWLVVVLVGSCPSGELL